VNCQIYPSLKIENHHPLHRYTHPLLLLLLFSLHCTAISPPPSLHSFSPLLLFVSSPAFTIIVIITIVFCAMLGNSYDPYEYELVNLYPCGPYRLTIRIFHFFYLINYHLIIFYFKINFKILLLFNYFLNNYCCLF